MRSDERSRSVRPVRRHPRTLALAAVALAGALAFSVAAPAEALSGQRLAGCGWNEATDRDHASYEHCATDTNVWIQVTRTWRSDYHRCVGPGRTVLDSDASGAWYDSNYQGGTCSHPGDTGP
ncbi:DUF6355 family natural product biosynthesis protein [Streptomyces beijiangensis]|uniref:Secreted protein n=1 Tax=Streptomyces beijiangensis TaxID=163361 RepID=A0A939F7U4_9ACTN|nr:DUF6355 family natural product biosynthesis protein [Streptomyces beijiangensis]MBO0513224.1 hypothetical protein [Streptomyces beijiangensis]